MRQEELLLRGSHDGIEEIHFAAVAAARRLQQQALLQPVVLVPPVLEGEKLLKLTRRFRAASRGVRTPRSATATCRSLLLKYQKQKASKVVLFWRRENVNKCSITASLVAAESRSERRKMII